LIARARRCEFSRIERNFLFPCLKSILPCFLRSIFIRLVGKRLTSLDADVSRLIPVCAHVQHPPLFCSRCSSFSFLSVHWGFFFSQLVGPNPRAHYCFSHATLCLFPLNSIFFFLYSFLRGGCLLLGIVTLFFFFVSSGSPRVAPRGTFFPVRGLLSFPGPFFFPFPQ